MFISNKYNTWYYNIINTALQRSLNTGYTENHHIIPRCLGGNDELSNLVILTAREHFICHMLLPKFTNNQNKHKVLHAAIIMKSSNKVQDRYFNSRLYAKVRKEYSEYQKINMIGEGNPFHNKKHSDDSKQKMKNTKKDMNLISWNTGLTKETSTKLAEVGKNISAAIVGIRHWTNGIRDVKSKDCPGVGWYIGRSNTHNFKKTDEEKLSIKDRTKGGKSNWWNNGTINKRSLNCPGIDWIRGRLFSKSLYQSFCKHQIINAS